MCRKYHARTVVIVDLKKKHSSEWTDPNCKNALHCGWFHNYLRQCSGLVKFDYICEGQKYNGHLCEDAADHNKSRPILYYLMKQDYIKKVTYARYLFCSCQLQIGNCGINHDNLGFTHDIEAGANSTPLSRRHFQTHFLKWKYMNFASDFTENCSWSSN